MKLLATFSIIGFSYYKQENVKNFVQGQFWDKTKDGKRANVFTLKNADITMEVSDYAGLITKLIVPDKNGSLGDIQLGCATLKEYEEKSPYFGCIVGRYANRISKGQFELDGQTYNLAINNGPNHLHGEPGIRFNLTSPDGHEGYPGELNLQVTYWLLNENALRIDYQAKVNDKATVINVTNHSYFNLDGEEKNSTCLDHFAQINAKYICETDEDLIPNGNFKSLAKGPFDFTQLKRIGDRIDEDNQDLKNGRGYDHSFALKTDENKDLQYAASFYSPLSGRWMQVFTTEPGAHLYTSNFLTNDVPNKRGGKYFPRAGFCLETQHFPNSPNVANFPTTVLKPGEILESSTIFQFGTSKSLKEFQQMTKLQ